MYINKLSVNFTLIIFTISIIIFSYLRKNMQRLNISIKTLKFILTLVLLRLFLPFEFYSSIEIKSRRIYPFFSKIGRAKFFNSQISFFQIIIIFWLIGFILLLISDVLKTLKFKKQLKTLENQINNDEIDIYFNLIEKLEVKSPPKLVKAKYINCPFTIGFFKSEIYIEDITYSENDLTHILTHELIHHKSFDNFKKFTLMVLARFFWWNPLVQYLVDDIIQIMEIECDKKLLTYLPDKEDYIDAIISQLKSSLMKYRKEKLGVSYFVPSKSENIKQRLSLIEGKVYSKQYNMLPIIISIIIFISSYFFMVIPFNLPLGISNEANFMKVTKEERESYIKSEFNLKRDFLDKYFNNYAR